MTMCNNMTMSVSMPVCGMSVCSVSMSVCGVSVTMSVSVSMTMSVSVSVTMSVCNMSVSVSVTMSVMSVMSVTIRTVSEGNQVYITKHIEVVVAVPLVVGVLHAVLSARWAGLDVRDSVTADCKMILIFH